MTGPVVEADAVSCLPLRWGGTAGPLVHEGVHFAAHSLS